VVKVHFCLSFCRVIAQNDAVLGVSAKQLAAVIQTAGASVAFAPFG
jgi:hypothetical protein